MTTNDLLKHIATIKRRDQSALHKPLLILCAINQWQQQGQSFDQIKSILKKKKWLEKYSKTNKNLNMKYPFARLEETLWTIRDDKGQIVKRKNEQIKCRIESKPKLYTGALSSEVIELFKNDPSAVEKAIDCVLYNYFPNETDDQCQEIYEQMCGKLVPSRNKVWQQRWEREHKLRNKIMNIYKGRCAVCNYSVKFNNKFVGVEAAHVLAVQDGGSDEVNNGMALCSIHHKAFDSYVMGIDTQYNIKIAQNIKGYKKIGRMLIKDIDGHKCTSLESLDHPPSKNNLEKKYDIFKSRQYGDRRP